MGIISFPIFLLSLYYLAMELPKRTKERWISWEYSSPRLTPGGSEYPVTITRTDSHFTDSSIIVPSQTSDLMNVADLLWKPTGIWSHFCGEPVTMAYQQYNNLWNANSLYGSMQGQPSSQEYASLIRGFKF